MILLFYQSISLAFASSDHHHDEDHDLDVGNSSIVVDALGEEHVELNTAQDDDHDDEHEHEEGKAVISDEGARRSGIKSSIAGSQIIDEQVTLTGKITLNKDKTYDIPARFRGILKDIKVNWGDEVKKGQILAIVESNESLKDYKVTSPANGVVLEKHTNIGDVVGDEPLFKVADISEVWAEFHVFPKDIHSVNEGLSIHIHVLGNEQNASSKISMLLPTADELSQTVIAIAPLSNLDDQWRPGMVVEGDIMVRSVKANVAVKVEALQNLEDKTVVFVKEGEKTYFPKEVELGRVGKHYVEILKGLKQGEQYISSGSFIVKADILKSTAEHTH